MPIDNNYDGSQHPANSKLRTHPYAEDGNAIKLKGIEKYGGEFPHAWNGTIAADGTSLTVANVSGHQNPTPAYMKWVVTDQSGNEAYGALDTGTPTDPVVIDTSGLDVQDPWNILFNARKAESDGGQYVKYNVELEPGTFGVGDAYVVAADYD